MFGRPIHYGKPVVDHPLNRGLVGWWLPLPQWSGGSQLFDLLGRLPGTLTGGPTWTTVPGSEFGALTFDGSNDYVDLGNSTTFDVTAFSIVARIRLTATPRGGIFDKLNNGSFNGYTYVHNQNGMQVQALFVDAVGWQYSTTAIPQSEWCTVGVSFGGAFYLNGKADGSVTGGTPTAQTQTAKIGQDYAGNFLTGSIAWVQLYSRALSADEHFALYVQGLQQFPDLLKRVPSRVWSFATSVGGAPATGAVKLVGDSFRLAGGGGIAG